MLIKQGILKQAFFSHQHFGIDDTGGKAKYLSQQAVSQVLDPIYKMQQQKPIIAIDQ